MSISDELGERKEILLPPGRIRYRERGEGDPIVFLHPMVVNGDLWRKVVPLLAGQYRCLTPDLPLGGHVLPMSPAADLSPPGIARLIADFLQALDLEEVTLVGNDTGGAFAQIVATQHQKRLARMVLVTCDAFDNFPPRLAKLLVWTTSVPGLTRFLGRLAITELGRRAQPPLLALAKRPWPPQIHRSYLEPALRNRAVLRDCKKALQGLHARHTLAAAERLPGFDKPTLIVWNPGDRYFPVEHAYRLAEILPNARVELIDESGTFMAEDQPRQLAEAIGSLMA
jgi:pimeloyl-ACP methyl ester carboxylesterase